MVEIKDYKPVIMMDGAVPILTVAIDEGVGMIRIGPVRDVSRKTNIALNYFCQKIQPLLRQMMEFERMKGQSESVLSSCHAIQSLTRSALDIDGSMTIILGLCIKMIDASGGAFLYREDENFKVAITVGMEKEEESLFRDDRSIGKLMYGLVSEGEPL